MMFLGVLYRNPLIDKAKCIFNTIVDVGDNGATVASIITHVAIFEENWVKFPKTADELMIVTADKLDRRVPKYGLICAPLPKLPRIEGPIGNKVANFKTRCYQ